MHWEGYEEKEKGAVADTPIQTEKTLLGFGKPLPESQATAVIAEPKLRQVPCCKRLDDSHINIQILNVYF